MKVQFPTPPKKMRRCGRLSWSNMAWRIVWPIPLLRGLAMGSRVAAVWVQPWSIAWGSSCTKRPLPKTKPWNSTMELLGCWNYCNGMVWSQKGGRPEFCGFEGWNYHSSRAKKGQWLVMWRVTLQTWQRLLSGTGADLTVAQQGVPLRDVLLFARQREDAGREMVCWTGAVQCPERLGIAGNGMGQEPWRNLYKGPMKGLQRHRLQESGMISYLSLDIMAI